MTDSFPQCSVHIECNGYTRNYLQQTMKKQYTFSKTLTDKEYLEHLRTTYIEDGVLEAHRWSDLILLELAEEALEQLQKFKSRIRPLKHE